MLHRDGQCNVLIHNPSHVDIALIFGNDNQVISLVSILCAKLHKDFIGRAYLLIHLVKTAVAKYNHCALAVETQFEGLSRLLHVNLYSHFTLLQLRAIDGCKKGVIKEKIIVCMVLLYAFQINTIFFKLSQCY